MMRSSRQHLKSRPELLRQPRRHPGRHPRNRHHRPRHPRLVERPRAQTKAHHAGRVGVDYGVADHATHYGQVHQKSLPPSKVPKKRVRTSPSPPHPTKVHRKHLPPSKVIKKRPRARVKQPKPNLGRKSKVYML
ncbi:hypothetical protein ACGC1H_006257 [Rhizoctonia solani]